MSERVKYFGPRREPAVLVERFEELRAGAIVYDIGCKCGRICRAMLTTLTFTAREGVKLRAWKVEPPCRPAPAGKFLCVSEETVAKRRIYAVILEPPANTETRARRKELVDG